MPSYSRFLGWAPDPPARRYVVTAEPGGTADRIQYLIRARTAPEQEPGDCDSDDDKKACSGADDQQPAPAATWPLGARI